MPVERTRPPFEGRSAAWQIAASAAANLIRLCQFTDESHLDAAATVASYWDEAQYCASGCGNGLNDHWMALAGTAAAQAGYTPATLPDLATGLTLKATPAPQANVTYPASGDLILGTAIAAGATAIWSYTATIALTPAQAALRMRDHRRWRHRRGTLPACASSSCSTNGSRCRSSSSYQPSASLSPALALTWPACATAAS